MNTKSNAFFNTYQQKLNIHLNEVQKEAVLQTEGPLLLLATPGSGKTTTLIMRIGYLLEEKQIDRRRILAVTFSKAAAVDMQTRFETYFPEQKPTVFATIHRLAFQVVRNHYTKHQLSFKLIEGRVDPAYLHKRIILRKLYEEVHSEKVTEDQLDELSTFISYVKNTRLAESKWDEVDTDVPKAAEILRKYEQFKKSQQGFQLLDFDDMLTIANDLLEEDQNMLRTYQGRYDYVLTDESQDTSLVQHELIEKLVAEHENLCVVADDDQSIYSWRAADPSYLLNLKDVYPQANILKMERNYRSSKEIVDTANTFIKRNKNRYKKEMYTENPPCEPVQYTYLRSFDEQAEHVLKAIEQQVEFGDSAILFRNNSSAIYFVDVLERANVPFYMKEHDVKFFNHWIVADILNFMRLIYDPSRVDILERIHTKFKVFIGKPDVRTLQETYSDESVFQRLAKIPTMKAGQKTAFVKLAQLLKDSRELQPAQIIRKIRFDFGYYDVIQKMSERLGLNFDYLRNVLFTLENLAAKETTMEDFAKRLQVIELKMKEAAKNQGQDAITLSTFHSSKGLEFCHVYMVDLVKGMIPATTDETPELEAEAVRLFYVGMTRAKMHLHLFAYSEKHGRKIEASPFFYDVYKIIHGYPLSKHVEIEQKGVKLLRTIRKRPVIMGERSIQIQDELYTGLRINHRVFGEGTVTNISDDILEIKFGLETKTLQTEIALENGVLEQLED